MQADYRSRTRSNVRPLTHTRATLPGNQIGVCSSRATASSPSLGSMPAGYPSMSACLICKQAERLIGFLKDTFGGVL